MKSVCHWMLCLLLLAGSATVVADDPPSLPNGSALPELVRELETRFERQPSGANRFSLAAFRFVHGIEQFARQLYRYDPSSAAARMNVPFLRLPLPSNPNPETVTAAAIREMLEQFYRELQAVDALLQTRDDTAFKVPVAVASIALDVADDAEPINLASLLMRYNRRVARALEQNPQLVVHFDSADAHWLHGYSQLLMAMLDFALAHDWGRVFDQSAHYLFARADTPAAELARQPGSRFDSGMIADAIATLHVMNLPVIDAGRLAQARTRLLAVIEHSRDFWRAVAEESDDDNEWIPNPSQQAITGARISEQMSASWLDLLTEAEQVLRGDKLIPHWRIRDDRGVNLRRVFEEAKSFDPVLWAQGSAAIGFLERGERTSARSWRQMMRVFGGNFVGFALWVN